MILGAPSAPKVVPGGPRWFLVVLNSPRWFQVVLGGTGYSRGTLSRGAFT